MYILIFMSFKGNQCRQILKNISRLKIPPHLQAFSRAFKNLKYLHILVNSKSLPYNYEKIIDEFTYSWIELSSKFSVPVTPKIHIICDHLADYFQITGQTLSNVTDELTEAMHHFCKKRPIKGYFCKG